uniref:Uncharacterized protein n=1 Tax=Solanum lycopersicum TaxID=4081 RepID=K4D7M4_SOLLC
MACLKNVSNGDIVYWSGGIICWYAIFTPIYKHKASARKIILKYSKDSNIVNQEGGKTLAEFPNIIELGKLGSSKDPNNNEHSTTSKRGER